MIDYKLPFVKKGIALIVKSLGIALVSVVILFFIGNRVNNKTLEIIKNRDDFSTFTRRYELLDQLMKDNDFAEKNKAKMTAAIPSFDNLNLVADYLNNSANKTSNIASIHFDAPARTDEQSLNEVPFSIINTGTTQSLSDLLKEIENAPYFIEIKNISLSFKDGIGEQTDANLTGIVYIKNIYDEN